jgi:hypothetical protein
MKIIITENQFKRLISKKHYIRESLNDRTLKKIINYIKPPYFIDLINFNVPEEFWEVVLSEVFKQNVNISITEHGTNKVVDKKVYDKKGRMIYQENKSGNWSKWEYFDHLNYYKSIEYHQEVYRKYWSIRTYIGMGYDQRQYYENSDGDRWFSDFRKGIVNKKIRDEHTFNEMIKSDEESESKGVELYDDNNLSDVTPNVMSVIRKYQQMTNNDFFLEFIKRYRKKDEFRYRLLMDYIQPEPDMYDLNNWETIFDEVYESETEIFMLVSEFSNFPGEDVWAEFYNELERAGW